MSKYKINGTVWLVTRSPMGKTTTKEKRARITAKRIVAGMDTFRRDTGREIGLPPGIPFYRTTAIAYQIDGQPKVEIGK